MSNRIVRTGEATERHNSSGQRLTTVVIDAVSEATGVPVTDMGVELNDYVDPDALNGLFADRFDGTPREGGLLVFSMLGCEVRIYGDGQVVVTPE